MMQNGSSTRLAEITMLRRMMALLAAAALLGASPAVAQMVFGAGLGPTFSLEEGGGTDFHIMGTLRFGGEEGKPVAFRADGMLQFADPENVFIGTGNVLYNFSVSSDAKFRPYVIGGAGLYADGGTDFGVNAGAGATFPLGLGDSPARAFAEARFHAIFAEGNTVNQLPLTVGIMFRAGD
jgi:hypothetical protein